MRLSLHDAAGKPWALFAIKSSPNLNLRRDLWIVILSVLTAILWIYEIGLLLNHRYSVSTKNLYKLDSVKMLERAYKQVPAKSTVPDAIEFEDENRKTFIISGTRYRAIRKNSRLYDTLQYGNIAMTILTDKVGYANYYIKDKTKPIEVYDVVLGQTSFIDLNKANRFEYSRHILVLISYSAVYIVCLAVYLNSRRKMRTT